MNEQYLLDKFNSAIYFLPDEIKTLLYSLPVYTKISIDEIRIRVNKEISFTVNNKQIKFSEIIKRKFVVSKLKLEECFNRLCEYSVYSHQQEINNGFITVYGGHRVGICGTVIYENNNIKNIKNISSINIRVSREFLNISKNIIKFATEGLLISGPPNSGKTTLLRDIVYNLSNKYRVTLIDTRGEIAAIKNGIPENTVGDFCDIINLAKKCDGIEIAVRTLNPQIIAFDEITDLNEILKVKKAIYSGVNFILSIHLGSVEELKENLLAKELIKTNKINYVLFLDVNKTNNKLFNTSFLNNQIVIKEGKIID